MAKVKKVTATGAVALSLTTSGGTFRLVQATIHFATKPTTSESVILTLDAAEGEAYDATIASADPSTGELTGDIVIEGKPGDIYEKGDELVLVYPNTDGIELGARLITEPT